MSPPGGVEILGVLAAICVNFTKVVIPLVKHDNLSGSLNNPERSIGKKHTRCTKRIARFEERIRIESRSLRVESSLDPGLHQRQGRLKKEIPVIAVAISQPNSRDVLRGSRLGFSRIDRRFSLSQSHPGECEQRHRRHHQSRQRSSRRSVHHFSVIVSSRPFAKTTS